MPVLGDTTYLSWDTTFRDAGVSGANVTWNFSNLKEFVLSTRAYVDPANTIYSSKFPLSTLCRVDGNNDMFSYWDNNSSKADFYGFVEPNYYDQSYNAENVRYYKFPLNYGDSHVDSLFAVTNPGSIASPGKYYFSADGWGTLTLPNKTLTNVLRAKSVLYVGDSNFNNYGLTTEYAWYTANNKDPHLVINKVVINGSVYKKLVFFDNGNSTGIKVAGIATSEVKAFPNPFLNKLNIEIIDANKYNEKELRVFNIFGKLCYESNILSIDKSTEVNLESLSSGIYYLLVKDVDRTSSVKIIKQ